MDWIETSTQLVAVLVGGGMVILANEITDRRKRRSQNDQDRSHDRIVFTAIFVIRNKIMTAIDKIINDKVFDQSIFHASHTHIQFLLTKSQLTSQSLIHQLYSISLALDTLILELENSDHFESEEELGDSLISKINNLIDVFSLFDFQAPEYLEFVDEEFLKNNIEGFEVAADNEAKAG